LQSSSGRCRPGSVRRLASLSNAALRPASVTLRAACFNAMEFLPETGCRMGVILPSGDCSDARTRTWTVRNFTDETPDSCLTSWEDWYRRRAAQTGESAATTRVSFRTDRTRQCSFSGEGMSSCTSASSSPSARAQDRRREISLLSSRLPIWKGLFERMTGW
jgi:hypothetical protein